MTPSIQKSLFKIGEMNRNLAKELGRLPELSEFKTDRSRNALENLRRIYVYSPDRFDSLFDAMDKEGLKAVRPFCTPLQGLFWMVQDGKLGRTGAILGLEISRNAKVGEDGGRELRFKRREPPPDYSLAGILNDSWNGEAESALTRNIHLIINKIKTRAGTDEYAHLTGKRSRKQLAGYVMDDYLRQKEMFDAGDWDTIAKAVARSRWKCFYTVADRLNSPELINYYINRYFFFRKTPSSGVYFTFLEKKAQCTDAAYFTVFMLARAGYNTFIRSVKWDEDPWDGLHTGAGIILDNGTYLLVSNYTGINAISGPFDQVAALDRRIAGDRDIIHSQWGAYYPPRYF
ncbi:MAG: hypothetical protein MI802_23600 [Desulfobacterales bacterium]|nr:hypothetical protein [Desulfobacterales bacterium]